MADAVLTIGYVAVCIAAIFVGMACLPAQRVKITFWRIGKEAKRRNKELEAQWRNQ